MVSRLAAVICMSLCRVWHLYLVFYSFFRFIFSIAKYVLSPQSIGSGRTKFRVLQFRARGIFFRPGSLYAGYLCSDKHNHSPLGIQWARDQGEVTWCTYINLFLLYQLSAGNWRLSRQFIFCLIFLSKCCVLQSSLLLDCEQSLFSSSNTRGEEHKTSSLASVSVSVTCTLLYPTSFLLCYGKGVNLPHMRNLGWSNVELL